MSKDRGLLPDKKEERDLLTQVLALAPLIEVILRIIELALKIAGVIN